MQVRQVCMCMPVCLCISPIIAFPKASAPNDLAPLPEDLGGRGVLTQTAAKAAGLEDSRMGVRNSSTIFGFGGWAKCG